MIAIIQIKKKDTFDASILAIKSEVTTASEKASQVSRISAFWLREEGSHR